MHALVFLALPRLQHLIVHSFDDDLWLPVLARFLLLVLRRMLLRLQLQLVVIGALAFEFGGLTAVKDLDGASRVVSRCSHFPQIRLRL